MLDLQAYCVASRKSFGLSDKAIYDLLCASEIKSQKQTIILTSCQDMQFCQRNIVYTGVLKSR